MKRRNFIKMLGLALSPLSFKVFAGQPLSNSSATWAANEYHDKSGYFGKYKDSDILEADAFLDRLELFKKRIHSRISGIDGVYSVDKIEFDLINPFNIKVQYIVDSKIMHYRLFPAENMEIWNDFSNASESMIRNLEFMIESNIRD